MFEEGQGQKTPIFFSILRSHTAVVHDPFEAAELAEDVFLIA
jgi:hypothetical protein